MKKKENFCITAIEDVYLLRIQITEESGVKCFFEVTISKEIDKMSHDKGKKLLERIDHLFYSCLDDFQKEIIRERKLKSEKIIHEGRRKEMTEKEIKKMTSRTEITFEELQEAASPLVELLRKKGHPHMTVLVTDWNIELVEALKGIPMPYED